MRKTTAIGLLIGLLFANTALCQSGEKKEVTISAGSGVTFTSQPKYEKPKKYDSSATTSWSGTQYKINVAMVNIPTGGGFQMPCLEAEAASVYIARADEVLALLSDETTLRENADAKATDKPIAATLEPLEGKAVKATAGTEGMHIGIDLMSGQMNLGNGLALDIKTFDRKVFLKAGSLSVKGIQYTITEGACIVAADGKLVAYGVKRSQ